MIPDDQNTLTCQSSDMNNSPRDPLHGPVTVNSCRMRALRAEPVINDRRHTISVKPLKPVIVAAQAHKLINNVFLSYDCQLLIISCPTPLWRPPPQISSSRASENPRSHQLTANRRMPQSTPCTSSSTQTRHPSTQTSYLARSDTFASPSPPLSAQRSWKHGSCPLPILERCPSSRKAPPDLK